MEVSQRSGETWLLRVSVSGKGTPPAGAALIVPFHKNPRGEWEMSPALKAVQHIDAVPARRASSPSVSSPG